jgi:hypothetical protein
MDGTCDMDGKDDKYIKFQWGHLNETDHMEDLGRDERIILQRILKNLCWKGVDICEYGSDTSGDIKCREFNEQ